MNGRTLTVADGGSIAIANGARQPLVRDSDGAVRPIKLLWLVKAPPGTTLSLSAHSADGAAVAWLVDVGGPRTEVLAATTAVQSAPDASPEWSDVPSLLGVSTAGCYEITTRVDGAPQSIRILVG